MSDRDSFIDEVTEEVRRERLYVYLRRYGWIAVALVLVLVGGAAIWEWQRSQSRADARDFGDAVLSALSESSPEARREALRAIDVDGARRALVTMLAADTLEDAEARATTGDLLAEIAADADMPELYRDLAILKGAMLNQGEAPPAEVIETLDPLTAPGRPFRLLALEQQAVARVALGEDDAAISILNDILSDGAAPRDLQQRARQLIVALGGMTEAA